MHQNGGPGVPGLTGIVVMALLLASCGGGAEDEPVGADGPGVIVCTDTADTGNGADQLLVVNPGGGLLRTIAVDADIFPYVQGLGTWVLYQSISDDLMRFVDTATGDVTRVDQDLRWRDDNRRSRYVLANSGASSGGEESVALIDFSSGSITDVTEAVGAEELTAVVLWDIDDTAEHLLVWNLTSGLRVVPTADPGETILLGDRTRPGDLSNDGRRVVFVDADGRAMLGDLEGARFESIADGAIYSSFIDDSRVLIVRPGSVAISDGDAAEQTIWETQATFFHANLLATHDGSLSVVQLLGGGGDIKWLHVDADAGIAVELPLGEQMWIGAGDRYLIVGEASQPGTPYMDTATIVDIATGELRPVSLPSEGVQQMVDLSPSGESALLFGRSTRHLLDLSTGTMTTLREDLLSVRYSPDGRDLVMVVWDGEDRASAELLIGPVDDPATAQPIGVSCSNPVWANGT